MMAEQENFPFVRCDTHGRGLRGYAVCVHVIAGAVIRHLAHPRYNLAELGEALCTKCSDREAGTLKVDDLRVICSECMRAILNKTTVH